MTEPNFSKPRVKAGQREAKTNSTTHRARRHEDAIAARSGAQRVRGSGNQPGRPGDVRGNRFLREAKTTKGAGRAIKAEELKNLVEQALSLNKTPLLELRFEGQEAPVPTDWVLIPATDFEDLVRGHLGGE